MNDSLPLPPPSFAVLLLYFTFLCLITFVFSFLFFFHLLLGSFFVFLAPFFIFFACFTLFLQKFFCFFSFQTLWFCSPSIYWFIRSPLSIPTLYFTTHFILSSSFILLFLVYLILLYFSKLDDLCRNYYLMDTVLFRSFPHNLLRMWLYLAVNHTEISKKVILFPQYI